MESEQHNQSSTIFRKESLKFKDEVKKKGVIYMSRVPPFMKPNRVRAIFEQVLLLYVILLQMSLYIDQYGEISKLFLAEEDTLKRKRRRISGGNGSKQFTEGDMTYFYRALTTL
jgi:ESF2/ABP1 family protein